MNSFLNKDAPFLPMPGTARRMLLAVIEGREKRALTELIARLALDGPVELIAGGEWVPGHMDLRRAVRRHTTAVHATLERLTLTRPSTYLQLLDLLAEPQPRKELLLILDFLHLFYVPDVELSTRLRVLEGCCEHLHRIKLLRPLVVVVQQVPAEDYRQFMPLLRECADVVLEAEPDRVRVVSQPALV